MPKATKPKHSQLRRTSRSTARKVIKHNKNKANHLAASAMASRYVQDIFFAEFERHMMKQRKKDRIHALLAHEVAILDVFKLGPKVFENKDKFISWLNRPSRPLGGEIPLKLLLTRKAHLVRDELLRIEYGVYTG